MYKSLVPIMAALVVFPAGLLVSGRAEAGASASAPAKYSKAKVVGSNSWIPRYVTSRGTRSTDYSSSSAPRR